MLVTRLNDFLSDLLDGPRKRAHVKAVHRLINRVLTNAQDGLAIVVAAKQEHLVSVHHRGVIGDVSRSLTRWSTLLDLFPGEWLLFSVVRALVVIRAARHLVKIQFPETAHAAILDVEASHHVHLVVVHKGAVVAAALRGAVGKAQLVPVLDSAVVV